MTQFAIVFKAIPAEILFPAGLVDLPKALQVSISAGCVGYRIVASQAYHLRLVSGLTAEQASVREYAEILLSGQNKLGLEFRLNLARTYVIKIA